MGAVWFANASPNGASLFDYKIVPDPAKSWSQPYWAPYTATNDRVEAKFNSKLNDVFAVRTAYSYNQDKTAPMISIQNYWDDNKGTYDQFIFGNTATRSVTHSEYGFLDADLATGFIQHKVTMEPMPIKPLSSLGRTTETQLLRTRSTISTKGPFTRHRRISCRSTHFLTRKESLRRASRPTSSSVIA